VNLDGYRMEQDLYGGAGRFAGMIDFTNLADPGRENMKSLE